MGSCGLWIWIWMNNFISTVSLIFDVFRAPVWWLQISFFFAGAANSAHPNPLAGFGDTSRQGKRGEKRGRGGKERDGMDRRKHSPRNKFLVTPTVSQRSTCRRDELVSWYCELVTRSWCYVDGQIDAHHQRCSSCCCWWWCF